MDISSTLTRSKLLSKKPLSGMPPEDLRIAHVSREHIGALVPKLALAVPALWFIGTVPEGFAFGLLPGYLAIAIGSVAWLITMASDIYFERLALSGRSAVFGGLVMTGIIFQLLDRAAFQRLNRRF